MRTKNKVQVDSQTLHLAPEQGWRPLLPLTAVEMFQAAHFCCDLASDSLPPSYHPAVQQLQDQFPLLAASQLLLLSLGDNVRVNRQALDTARQLHDKQVEDLDSWLYCSQRNQMRDQFLLASQILKDTVQWEQLRSYMCLVELGRKENKGLEKLVMERTDRVLGALLVNDQQYIGTQQKIVEMLPRVMSLDKLVMLDKKVLAKVISEKSNVLRLVVKALTDALDNDESLEVIESVAEVVGSTLRHVQSSVSSDVLGRLETGIGNRFVREELTSCLVVRVSLGNRTEE